MQVQGAGDWYDYQAFVLDTIVLRPARRIRLTIHPGEEFSENLMYFKALELKPFKHALSFLSQRAHVL